MPPSILAEPRRRKQRLSIDPQNLQWRNSTTQNFGKKMLEQMGWRDGKGVGKNEQGTAENIRLKPNYVGKVGAIEFIHACATTKSLGNDGKSTKEAWMEHNDDFEAILATLNKQKSDGSIKAASGGENIKLKSNLQKKRVRVMRREHVKNLAQCSDYDKDCIFGRTAKKIKSEESTNPDNSEINDGQAKDTQDSEEPEVVADNKTVISTIAINDYFAHKMRRKLLNTKAT